MKSSLVSKLLTKTLGAYLRLHSLILRFFGSKLVPAGMEPLREFLGADQRAGDDFISRSGIKAFDGLHPKNVFNFRYEFFLENVNADDVVLDIACGTGLMLYKIHSKIQAGYGIEWNDENLALCARHHGAKNLTYIKSDIFKFDYAAFIAERGVTSAILSHIIEHIEDPVEFLKSLKIKTLLVCVPSQENWMTQLRMYLRLPYFKDATHFREYTRDMLRKELEAAGYTVSSIGYNAEGEIICRAALAS